MAFLYISRIGKKTNLNSIIDLNITKLQIIFYNLSFLSKQLCEQYW